MHGLRRLQLWRKLESDKRRCYFVECIMIDTFYLHLEFKDKKCGWSINLPFLCAKCGVCCTLEDFLTAGEVDAEPEEYPEVHAKIKILFDTLGKMWEADEAKYDEYTQRTPCPFLVNSACSIYEIRPRRLPTLPQNCLRNANPRLPRSHPIQETAHRPEKRQNLQRNLPLRRKNCGFNQM